MLTRAGELIDGSRAAGEERLTSCGVGHELELDEEGAMKQWMVGRGIGG